MKSRGKLLIILISIGISISGCSKSTKISTNSSTTQVKTEIASSTVDTPVDTPVDTKTGIKESEINISLNKVNFNLNKPFENLNLNNLDSKSLSILRNSIYAKYGYIFSTKEFSEYFSQFSWYIPTNKNVEEKLNSIDKENIKTILTLEGKKVAVLKTSKDNNDYSKAGKMELSLKGKKETLYITKEELKTSNDTNKPTKITLKINDSQIVFESLWNDGLGVFVADFDTTDNDMDIYITRSGTDIQCSTCIYKFDGKKIYKYDELSHLGTNFEYDEKGNIYYWMNDTGKQEFNKYYNYKTKQSSDRKTK